MRGSSGHSQPQLARPESLLLDVVRRDYSKAFFVSMPILDRRQVARRLCVLQSPGTLRPASTTTRELMSLNGLKALTFDTFGTVVDWRTSIISDFRAFGRRKGINIDWEAFTDEWKTCYRAGMDAVRSGAWPWTTVDAIYRSKLDEILPAYGVHG